MAAAPTCLAALNVLCRPLHLRFPPTADIMRFLKPSACVSSWLAVGLVGLLGACGSSTSRSPVTLTSSGTTIAVVPHSSGVNDVVLQVGNYQLGGDPGRAVTGPEIVLYGDGSLYAELFDGVHDGQATWSRVHGKLSETQVQSLLAPGEGLAADPPMNTLDADGWPTQIVSAAHRWLVNDFGEEPFVGYLTKVRTMVRSYATEEWVPERWVVRVADSPTCTVTNAPSSESSYDAPVYPGVLDYFQLGTVDCDPIPPLP